MNFKNYHIGGTNIEGRDGDEVWILGIGRKIKEKIIKG